MDVPDANLALQAAMSDPASLEKARAAVSHLMRAAQWRPAAGVLRRTFQSVSPTLSDLLTYGSCLARAEMFGDARALACDLQQLLSDMSAGRRQSFGDLALPLYRTAAVLFADGHRAQAEAIVDLILPHEPFGRRLLGLEVPADDLPRPAELSEPVVADFIRRTIADSVAGRRVPAGRAHAGAAYEKAFAPFRGRRVLIVHRERYWPNLPAPHPAPEYLCGGALEAGLDARTFCSDQLCVIPCDFAPNETAAAFATLRERIEAWRPDYVVYENFGYPGGDRTTRQMLDLRGQCGFRLAGVYHDVWEPGIVSQIAAVNDSLDAVWAFDPVATSPALQTLRRCVATVPTIPEGPFAAARVQVTVTDDIGFIGSIAMSNFVRGIWIMEAQRRGLPIRLVTNFPEPLPEYQTQEGFARFIAGCKVSLSVCGRTTQADAIPARIWETILAGSALLVDDTPQIRHLLTPFAHYIPFRTVEELIFYARFLAARDDIRAELTGHAYDFIRDAYPAVRAWHELLSMAEGQAANAS